MSARKKKVVVAMSGGVDSSVAAALLLREGYEVVGAFMRLGTPRDVQQSESASSCDPKKSSKQGCCSVLDAADAHRVAAALGIPLYVLNFEEDFSRVVDYFVDEYNRGRTPNPCVRCNDWLKFGKLARYAEAIEADFIATGHYARLTRDESTNAPQLRRGLDVRKDQSYVLFGLSPAILSRTLLPIGELEKPAVRELARELALPVYNKPDSQEICFVPDQDYAGVVKRRAPDAVRAGELVASSGEVIGEHGGHQHFTIGQRKGLGVSLGHRIYVVDVDAARNRVTVGEKEELFKRELIARQINLLHPSLSRDGASVRCIAKIRYNAEPQPASARVSGDDELTVTFDEPQCAIAPGQAVVIYGGDVVLGGGWIEKAL